MTATGPDVFERTTRNRLELADLLGGLSAEQWTVPSLCAGWDVRHVAAHLVQPMVVGFGRFLLVSFRYRGDTAATVDHVTRRLARRDPAALVAELRAHAEQRVDPPRVGPMGPFAETCLHRRDIGRPLGLPDDVRPEDWTDLLTYLCAPGAAPGLVDPGRTDGLALAATDADARWGAGREVVGPLEALAMAITGRESALQDLQGPGVAQLRDASAR